MPGTDRVEIRTLKVGRFCVVDEEAYKILSISKSKPGKHGSAKARLELVSLFSSKKISHVGTVTDNIHVPMIEKGKAMVTHIDGEEVHAMNMKDHSMMILPVDSDISVESGQEILWMEALGRYKIER
ncbi:MAG: translation initiation factor IF-5A [Candidatus Poseidoniaceae archaeon]|nr:translation initiation factor IF-5A [Candidatus Poseidoniaceae archaeon]